jgi:hypothetical protein
LKKEGEKVKADYENIMMINRRITQVYEKDIKNRDEQAT